MGLRSWWKEGRRQSALNRQSVALNNDQQLIAQQVPELIGMSDVEGMAYVLQQIQEWNKNCTGQQAAIFANRSLASSRSFEADGSTMPYWANLWVLRTYQHQLGFDVPSVAPQAVNSVDEGRRLGEDARLALDRFVETHIVPRRQAFIDVFEDQLASLDQRLAAMSDVQQVTREDLARADYQILQENWRERRDEQREEALVILEEPLRRAEAIGCGPNLRSAIEQALSRQDAILVSEGLTVLLRSAA